MTHNQTKVVSSKSKFKSIYVALFLALTMLVGGAAFLLHTNKVIDTKQSIQQEANIDTQVDDNVHAASCTITYNANGGSFARLDNSKYSGGISTRTYTTTSSTYTEMPIPYRSGYHFNGWKYGNTTYSQGSALASTSSHTLTASWSQNTTNTIYMFKIESYFVDNGNGFWNNGCSTYSYTKSSSNQYFVDMGGYTGGMSSNCSFWRSGYRGWHVYGGNTNAKVCFGKTYHSSSGYATGADLTDLFIPANTDGDIILNSIKLVDWSIAIRYYCGNCAKPTVYAGIGISGYFNASSSGTGSRTNKNPTTAYSEGWMEAHDYETFTDNGYATWSAPSSVGNPSNMDGWRIYAKRDDYSGNMSACNLSVMMQTYDEGEMDEWCSQTLSYNTEISMCTHNNCYDFYEIEIIVTAVYKVTLSYAAGSNTYSKDAGTTELYYDNHRKWQNSLPTSPIIEYISYTSLTTLPEMPANLMYDNYYYCFLGFYATKASSMGGAATGTQYITRTGTLSTGSNLFNQNTTIYISAAKPILYRDWNSGARLDWNDGHIQLIRSEVNYTNDTSSYTDVSEAGNGTVWADYFADAAPGRVTFFTNAPVIYLPANCSSMFRSGDGTSSAAVWSQHLETLDLTNFSFRDVTKMYYMFADHPNLTTITWPSTTAALAGTQANFGNSAACQYVFSGDSKLTRIEIPSWFKTKTSTCTDYTGMFNGCSSLKYVDLRYLQFGAVQSASNTADFFGGCDNLKEIMVPLNDCSGLNAGGTTDQAPTLPDDGNGNNVWYRQDGANGYAYTKLPRLSSSGMIIARGYTISLDKNGGSGGSDNFVAVSGASDVRNVDGTVATLEAPEKPGSSFLGYNTEFNDEILSDDMNPIDNGEWYNGTWTITQSGTLYAQWEILSRTLTIKYYYETSLNSTDLVVSATSGTVNGSPIAAPVDNAIDYSYATVVSEYGDTAISVTIEKDNASYEYFIEKDAECYINANTESATNSAIWEWTPNADAEWRIYVRQKVYLTVNYYSMLATDTTKLRVVTTRGEVTVDEPAGSAYYASCYTMYGSNPTIPMSRVNSSKDYYISKDAACTTSSSLNTLNETWNANALNTTWNIYVAERYAVTYKSNGSTSGSAPATQYKIHGEDITLQSNSGNLAKTDYRYVGWSEVANDTDGTPDYNESAAYIYDGDVILYPAWTRDTHTLTINYYHQSATDDTAIGITQQTSTITGSPIAKPTENGETYSSATVLHDNSSSAINVTISRVNTNKVYIIKVGSIPTDAAVTANTCVYSWTPNQDAEINVYVCQVYTVTLSKGTGISAVSNGGTETTNAVKYLYGQDASIDATVAQGFTWSKWTQTSGGAEYSTTKDITISNVQTDWALTAVATANQIELPEPTDGAFQATYKTYGSWSFAGATGGTGSYKYEITNQGGLTGVSIPTSTNSTFTGTPSCDVGQYSVTVKATDKISGSEATREYWFDVNQKGLTNSMPRFGANATRQYNGAEQSFPTTFEMRDGGTLMTNNVDYVIYGDTAPKKDVGTYIIQITGQGNYTGTITAEWAITAYAGDAVIIGLDNATFTYNGALRTVNVTITLNGNDVTADFNISGNTGTDAGNYTVTVNGKGENVATSATKQSTWKIDPKSVAVVWNEYEYPVYNGYPHALPTGVADTGIAGQSIELSYKEKTLLTTTVTQVGQYYAVAEISSVLGGNKNNYTLTNNEKYFEVAAADNVISKRSDATMMVLDAIDIKNYLNISLLVENDSDIHYNIKSRENNEIVANISSNSILTVSALARNIDNAQTLIVTASVDTTANYGACSVDITVTVNKYTATMQWITAEDMEYQEAGKIVKASVTSDAGECGTIAYTSGNTTILTVNPNTGDLTANKAGTVKVTATAQSTTTVKSASIEYDMTISKKEVDDPTLQDGMTYTYSGVEQTAQFVYNTSLANVSGYKGTNVGEYTATFTLKDKTNYRWKVAGDDNATVNWEIVKRSITRPTVSNAEYVYNGGVITLDITNTNDQEINGVSIYAITDYQGQNVGSYTATISLNDAENNKWATGDESADISINWAITKAPFNIPENTVTYKKSSGGVYVVYKCLTGVRSEYLNVEYTLSGENNAGEYTYPAGFGIVLMDADEYLASNYDISSVGKLTVSADSVTIPVAKTEVLVYDGEAKEFEFENYEDFADSTTTRIYKDNVLVTETINAGIYIVEISLENNYSWTDKSTAPRNYTFEIQRAVVEIPTLVKDSFGYTGGSVEVSFNNMSQYISASGDLTGTNVGTYTVTLTTDSNHCFAYENDEYVITAQVEWRITQAQLAKPALNAEYANNNSYTGSTINILDYVDNFEEYMELIGIDVNSDDYDYHAKNVGTYYAKFSIKDKTKYVWEDETTEDVILEWTILPALVKTPNVIGSKDFVFNNTEITLEFEQYDRNIVQITGDTQKYANQPGETYTAEISLRDTANYVWLDTRNSDPRQLTWTISKASITKPTIVGIYRYTGETLEVEFDVEIDENLIRIEGGTKIEAGVSTIRLVLIDTDNCMWKDDNTTEPYEIEWTIEKAYLDAPELHDNRFEYDGQEHTVSLLTEDEYEIDIDQSELTGINAGTYTVVVNISEEYKANWIFADDQETVSLTWTIAKKQLAYPTLEETAYIYSGDRIEVVLNGFDDSTMKIEGSAAGTDATKYKFTIELIDTNNYEWADGEIGGREYNWSIVKSNAPLIIALSVAGGVLVASGVGFAIYSARKKKKRKLKLKQAEEE